MRLVDTRWAGIAHGVGTQRIIGRIHTVQIQIGNDHLTTSFTVLAEQSMDMLLGLDMLKRHQCSIDLKKNVLTIGTTGAEAAFLAEGEFKKKPYTPSYTFFKLTVQCICTAVARGIARLAQAKRLQRREHVRRGGRQTGISEGSDGWI